RRAGIGGDAGDDARDPDQRAELVGDVAGKELRHLVYAGGEDDRTGDEEREMRGVAMLEAEQQAAHHGGAGARDAGQQRRALPQPDDERLTPRQFTEAAGAAAQAPQPLAS